MQSAQNHISTVNNEDSHVMNIPSKGELHKAEEYYRLATLADPTDSKILMQYAKLESELNHDQGRALVNFERAVQAAPQNR
ncbi:hypothetical protein OIU77_003863 [Salix suchowensis]|uniref:Uncharacterized protein n=1 Tax=Salix suchowensis TaxID=1278906 RepID=A0ABQ9AV52_9ROSI|nr:hypothetical protein OIU77_003863 [Salix suchowensis]